MEPPNQRAKVSVVAQNIIDSSTLEEKKVSLRSKASGIRSREDETRKLEVAVMRQLVQVQTRRDKHREEVEELRREEDEFRSLEEAQRRRWDETQIQKDKPRREADEV